MSYILEALKKSQQERELGQVPRLQSVTFDEPPEPGLPTVWVYAALGLALAAVLIASYALFQRDASRAGVPTAGMAPEAAQGNAVRTGAIPPESATVARTAVGDATPAAADQPLDAAAVASSATGQAAASPETDEEPQVLVVPAPPRPGQPLPRGAEELRRAVLGDPAPLPPPVAPVVEQKVPVPDDLVADIEAFKRQVRGAPEAEPGQGAAPTAAPASEQASEQASAPKPARAANSGPAPSTMAQPAAASRASTARVPPPSTALRRQLPEFVMAVHVYDAEPGRRFVYINGRKLREQEQSREGLKLEQVVADGAILSWQGEQFFQPR
ncbi:hypothetical protein F2Q65_03785 [Thiohalocapsa marina]|uniref:Type II secretion system protein GspB C-terminal domain-containing protein n=1 Tax=Thiohalocapsa marina TaxID=424902 RepID=A0A5M8FT95_9GAMM|nr:general secretion pathway protein GspB [Thiohalocapsa marina]KAA6187020.1 hypothetical protein F2Q65_03785 [Thiohalocapsa marina]